MTLRAQLPASKQRRAQGALSFSEAFHVRTSASKVETTRKSEEARADFGIHDTSNIPFLENDACGGSKNSAGMTPWGHPLTKRSAKRFQSSGRSVFCQDSKIGGKGEFVGPGRSRLMGNWIRFGHACGRVSRPMSRDARSPPALLMLRFDQDFNAVLLKMHRFCKVLFVLDMFCLSVSSNMKRSVIKGFLPLTSS